MDKEQSPNKKKRGRAEWIVWFLILQLTMLIYATTSIFSKNASAYPALSIPFLLFYAGMILVLGIYAVLWQQVIKHLPLTLAYANKAVNIIWGLLFGIFIFSEKIHPLQILGCGVIIAGTVLYMRADLQERKNKEEGV